MSRMEFDSDDASAWANFTPGPTVAEEQRVLELISDSAWARELLNFGLRPVGRMDDDPYDQPKGLEGPWQPETADITREPVLVNVQTGCRFLYDAKTRELALDLDGSDNVIGAQYLLARAIGAATKFAFHRHAVRASGCGISEAQYCVVEPLTLEAGTRRELDEMIAHLRALFCGRCGARRLWFRGQRQEYFLKRSRAMVRTLYGLPSEVSLHPSLGRYAATHPDGLGFGFAFHGPNHYWKKPFLIWMMRENPAWWVREPRCLEVLSEALRDDDDQKFSRLLLQIQMSPLECGDPPFLSWPDEADDLRQWFFALMKRYEFGVTLQQYGYYSSLLDVTDNLNVALYFTQARLTGGAMRCLPPQPGRIIYVFAEANVVGNFFKHGRELFWGDTDWSRTPPPRLARQSAGFIVGSTNRTQNLYSRMIVATIRLGEAEPATCLGDDDLFPGAEQDLLLATLKESRPAPEGLY